MRSILLALTVAMVAAYANAAPVQKVADVPFAGGSQAVLYVGPSAPTAIVVSFTGGAGQLKIGQGGNFLVRTREEWVQRGIGVVIPDMPAGYSTLFNKRNTPEYADAAAK